MDETERERRGGQELGIEREDNDHEQEPKRPWDPARIRMQTKTYGLKQVVDEISDGDIDLAPDFQRSYVWKERQRSRLIESVLLGIPLPAFYFNQVRDGRMQVVDGVQRLSTISRFVADQFPLVDLEYLDALEGHLWSQLEQTFKRRFNQTQIYVHVIDPQTPPDVKFDIFKRINTGGSPLTSQEIRHAISLRRSRDLLRRMSEGELFHRATNNSLDGETRMEDRELALRFIALTLDRDLSRYARAATLDDYLLAVTRDLDDPSVLSDPQITELEQRFERALANAVEVFGTHAFRKWPEGDDRHQPINRALFDSWSVVLAEFDPADLRARRDPIVARARKTFRENQAYVAAVSVGTNGVSKVHLRLEVARAILQEGLG